jgi:D-lactate dehydrogenase (cytochrome)
VSAIVRACAKHETPVIPFGTGTSLEGHVAALHGGICIDLSQMNRVLRVNVEDLDVAVEPGVTRKQLNNHLKESGLFFPIDPGADASLGGMAATRASGTNAVRYGTMRENVLGLTRVRRWRIIRTGGRARKSAAGYDLTRLFVGSEGTLGVITEITLRLYGIPEAISAAVGSFPTLEDAVDTVIQTIQSGIPVARIELLDDVQMDALNRYAKLDYPVQSTLFFEFHGTQAGWPTGGMVRRSRPSTAPRLPVGDQARGTQQAVAARHVPVPPGVRPGGGWATDVCVPISRLAECISGPEEIRARRCRPSSACRRQQFPLPSSSIRHPAG